jgi:hypothetical protein
MKLSRIQRRKIVAAVREDREAGETIRDARRSGRARGRPILETSVVVGDIVVAVRDFVGFFSGTDRPYVAIKQGTVGTIINLIEPSHENRFGTMHADVLFPQIGLATATTTRVLRSVSDTDDE